MPPEKYWESSSPLCPKSEWCLAISQELCTIEKFFPVLKRLSYFHHGTDLKSMWASLSFSLFFSKNTGSSLSLVQRCVSAAFLKSCWLNLRKKTAAGPFLNQAHSCVFCLWHVFDVATAHPVSPKLVSVWWACSLPCTVDSWKDGAFFPNTALLTAPVFTRNAPNGSFIWFVFCAAVWAIQWLKKLFVLNVSGQWVLEMTELTSPVMGIVRRALAVPLHHNLLRHDQGVFTVLCVISRCYWGFHSHFSREAEHLYHTLESSYQKALQSHLKNSDSIVSLPQSDRSSSSSQESLK